MCGEREAGAERRFIRVGFAGCGSLTLRFYFLTSPSLRSLLPEWSPPRGDVSCYTYSFEDEVENAPILCFR